ncbi:MAG: imidazolonepropionase [Halanaerobium sp.]|nr:imidazolonepropionase [Halanaerobium sp.]
MNRLLIKNAGELITCAGGAPKRGTEMGELGIIEDGAVTVEDGKITRVGRTGEILRGIREEDFMVFDAKGKPVLPGFIDPHTHFVFAGYRADEFSWRLAGIPYMEIMERGGGILSTVNATRQASFDLLKDNGLKRLNSMLTYGVTTVEGKSGYGLDLATELRQVRVMEELNDLHPVDIVITFLGAHAFPPEYKDKRESYISLLIEDILPEVAATGAEFCDVFCDRGVFTVGEAREILLAGQELGLVPKLHADEIARVGGAELAAELNAISADHLLKASRQGLQQMAARDVMAVLLPMTAFSLKEPYADGRSLVDMEVPVALATDFNPGSCYSESIPLLFALAALYMQLTTEEIISALTINAAAAIGRESKIGSIEEGKDGDLLILDCPSYQHLTYHLGVNLVEKVFKRGRLVKDNKEGEGYY